MLKLKVHTKPISKFTDIDKYVLIPKKYWEDFNLGEITLKIKGDIIKARIHDTPCDCTGKMHKHRIIDLRDSWDTLKIKEGESLLIKR